MCDELNRELQRGNAAGFALVKHLHHMGASMGTMFIEYAGKEWEVSVNKVRHLPYPNLDYQAMYGRPDKSV